MLLHIIFLLSVGTMSAFNVVKISQVTSREMSSFILHFEFLKENRMVIVETYS